MGLLEALQDRSIAVVLGDGGVGKTTVAASLSALAAASGRRVLTVTVDPSNRLKDALRISGAPGVEEAVPLPADGGTPPAGTLHAMVLDAATELDRLVRRVAPSDQVRDRITGNVFYRKAAATMAGTHEYMAMERLLEALESKRYDLVVLDTPPERHALDFLDAPARLDALLGSDAFRLFVSASAGLSRAGLEAVRFKKLVLRGIGKFAGEETFLALLDFVLAFAPMFQGFRDRAGRVGGWLTGPGCATFVVCRPGLRCGEAVRVPIEALRARGISPSAVIVNRVHLWPPPGARAGKADLVDAASMKDALLAAPALGLYDRQALVELAGRTLGLASRYRARATEDGERLAMLQAAVTPTPVYALPELRDEVRDLPGLVRFADLVRDAHPLET